MPKFNLDINAVDVEAAEAREDWKGPLPPKGSYPARLKVAKIKEIANGKEQGKHRIQIVATIDTEKDPNRKQFHGCPVFGGVNLTDQGAQYVNQFLLSLTDGSDSEYNAIKKSFYAGPIVDEKKENITKIGKHKVASPDGNLPILISVGHNTYKGETSAKIVSFLARGADSGASDVADEDDEDVVEEDSGDEVDEDAGDESVFDDEDEDE